MGKLKISKNKKPRSTKGTSGIPNWLLSTVIIVVVLAVASFCICSAVFNSGVIGRNTMTMELGDLEVNENMMNYYFRTNYISILSNLSTYTSYLGENQLGLDATKSLKDQPFKPFPTYPYMAQSLLSSYGIDSSATRSWYDTILLITKKQVTEYLIYAKAAQDKGITLDAADQETVDMALDNVIYEIMASTGAYSFSYDACCEMAYGEGVTADDVREAIELQMLASKMSTQMSNSIESSVKADDNRINNTYNENTKLFNYVDYFAFSYDVYYEDVVKELYGSDKKSDKLTDDEKKAALIKYEEKIKQAKKRAEELSSVKTLDEFKAIITEFTANEEYAGVYETAIKDLKSEDLPKTEDLATIKNTLIANVIKEIEASEPNAIDDVKTTKAAEGATDKTDKYSIYDIEITKKFADAIKSTKNNLFATVVSVLDAAECEKVYYYDPEGDETDPISEWIFGKGRVTGEAKVFETGDGADDAKVEAKTNSFNARVIVLTKTSYKDLTRSRDFAYLLYTKEAAAKTAITELGKIEKLDKDKFLALAESTSNPADAHQFIEDCVIATMGSAELDEWLFADTTKIGDYTKTAIKMSDGSYMVALYVKQNVTPEWKYQVMQHLMEEDYTKAETEMKNKYTASIVEDADALKGLLDVTTAYTV